MANVSSLGIGSGVLTSELVTSLLDAEREPAEALLDLEKEGLESEISAIGKLKSSLSQFQAALNSLDSVSDFNKRVANSGDEDLFTATADGSAVSGSYNIEVDVLAEAHKLATTAFTTSEAIGTGTLTITVGSDSFSLDIDSSNNTLAGIQGAINSSTSNTGVTATLITDDDGTKLVFTSDETGTANDITITVANDGDGDDDDNVDGLSRLYYDPNATPSSITNLTELNASVDAVVFIDGLTVTSSSNTVEGAIEGVTLNLLDVSADGVTDTLDVSLDKEGAKESINAFIEAYNSFIKTADELSSFDAETGEKSALFGDATLRSVLNQIRREVTNEVDGLRFTTLSVLGITSRGTSGLASEKDASGNVIIIPAGSLVLEDNPDLLGDALDLDFDAVGDLFSSSNGIAKRLSDLVDTYNDDTLSSDGILDARIDTLNDELTDVDVRRSTLLTRLSAREAVLASKFAAADAIIASLNTTSDFLTQNLVGLNKSDD